MTDAYGIPKPTRIPKAQRERNPTKPYRDDIPRDSHERQTSLKPIGRRAKRDKPLDDAWRLAVRELWGGRCIITQEDRPDHCECHHCFDKSYRPEWKHEVWNGIILEKWTLHRLCDQWPSLHKAFEQLATNQRGRLERKEPLMTRVEARALLFDLCPEVRQFARPEVER